MEQGGPNVDVARAGSPHRRDVPVAPSRDEAATPRRTLDGVLRRTAPPARLVFVDDGAADETRTILAARPPRDLPPTVRRAGLRVGTMGDAGSQIRGA